MEEERRAHEQEESKASEEYIRKLLAEEEEQQRLAEEKKKQMTEQLLLDERLARELNVNLVSLIQVRVKEFLQLDVGNLEPLHLQLISLKATLILKKEKCMWQLIFRYLFNFLKNHEAIFMVYIKYLVHLQNMHLNCSPLIS